MSITFYELQLGELRQSSFTSSISRPLPPKIPSVSTVARQHSEASTNGHRRSLTVAVQLNSGNSLRQYPWKNLRDASACPPGSDDCRATFHGTRHPINADNWTAASDNIGHIPMHLGDPSGDCSSNQSAPVLDMALLGRLPWDPRAHDGSAC